MKNITALEIVGEDHVIREVLAALREAKEFNQITGHYSTRTVPTMWYEGPTSGEPFKSELPHPQGWRG